MFSIIYVLSASLYCIKKLSEELKGVSVDLSNPSSYGCRFRMVAVPGEAIVSTKVEAIKQFKKVKLASLLDPQRRPLSKIPALKVTVKAKQTPQRSTATQTGPTLKRKLVMGSTSGRLMEDFSKWAHLTPSNVLIWILQYVGFPFLTTKLSIRVYPSWTLDVW